MQPTAIHRNARDRISRCSAAVAATPDAADAASPIERRRQALLYRLETDEVLPAWTL
jgi:hypothetical protein